MSDGTFITLQDLTVDGNQLFGGNKIILHCDSYTISGKPITQSSERQFQEVQLNSADAASYASNFNRRKGNVSYMGFTNSLITLKGSMSLTAIGSDTLTNSSLGSTWKVLTPTRFMKICHMGRKFFMDDDSWISALKTADADGSTYYSSSGMPVVIESWSIEPTIGEDRMINWTIALTEDKD